MIFHKIVVALSPLVVLFIAMILACLLAYSLLIGLGDVLAMDKLISKGTQLFLVLSIFPLVKYLKFSWKAIGFLEKPLFYQELRQGFIVGIAVLLPVISLLYFLDVREFDVTKQWTVFLVIKTVLFSALIPAFLISFIEEPVFRGILLSAQAKHFVKFMAVMIAAICYAGLHFLKTDLEIAYEDITVFSGFELIADALSNAMSVKNFSAFWALLMVGIFLGVARLYQGLGLGFCIGCHSAWVFLIKVTKRSSSLDHNADYFYLVSPYDGVIGSLVSVWLLIVISGYFTWRYYQR